MKLQIIKWNYIKINFRMANIALWTRWLKYNSVTASIAGYNL